MANPNIWAPGTAINANNSVSSQAFIATAGQALFTITEFQYSMEAGTLYVYIGGLFQRPGIDFTETSQTSFTLTNPIETEGTTVSCVAFTEISAGYEYAADAIAAQAAAEAAAAAAALSETAAASSESASAASAVLSAASAAAAVVSEAAAAAYASVGFDVASTLYDFGFVTDPSLTFTTDYGTVI